MEVITLQEAIATLENLLNSECKEDVLCEIKSYKTSKQTCPVERKN